MNRRQFFKAGALAIASSVLPSLLDEHHPTVADFSLIHRQGILGSLKIWKDRDREGRWRAYLIAHRDFCVNGMVILVYPMGKAWGMKPLVYDRPQKTPIWMRNEDSLDITFDLRYGENQEYPTLLPEQAEVEIELIGSLT